MNIKSGEPCPLAGKMPVSPQVAWDTVVPEKDCVPVVAVSVRWKHLPGNETDVAVNSTQQKSLNSANVSHRRHRLCRGLVRGGIFQWKQNKMRSVLKVKFLCSSVTFMSCFFSKGHEC